MYLYIEKYIELYDMITSRFDKLERKLELLDKKKECFDGDKLFDN